MMPDRERRMELRTPRVRARLAEIGRLASHDGQQHAIALLLARGHRRAAQNDPKNRDWWLAGARAQIERARGLR